VPAVPPVPGTKIAVIDFEQAVLESDAGKAATAEFNKEMEPEKARFEKLEKEVNDLQKKLQDAKTDAEKDPFRRELDLKNKEAQRIQEDAQQKSNDLRQKLLGPIAQLVNRVVDQYAKANNLAVVFDPNTQPTNIIFASKAADITAEIMRMMNEEFAKNPKLTAPAASNAPAASAKPNN
jgi:outer membrane protein